MKYIVLLGDGMADEPIEALGGRTPLQHARTPNMDRIAREGACGLLRTIPDAMEAGSDIANLSILGYDPARYYTGRGPLEAANIGVPLLEGDIAYRCNLVTVRDGVMQDFSAGHIGSEEGAALIRALDAEVSPVRAYPGISYRNLLVVPGGEGAVTTPPHDIVGRPCADYLPRGGDRERLLAVMEASRRVFAHHPLNAARVRAGKPPATMVWPWSGGRRPSMPSFAEKYGLPGGMISAVDLLNGIARYAGMEVIRVPGATGYLDTDYQAKARYALAALERLDFVYLHVEATDEASHLGSLEEKIRALERFDGMVGTILDRFDGVVAVLPDHATPLRLKTHTRTPVPFAVLGRGTDGCGSFSESEAAKGMFGTMNATEFLPMLFGRDGRTV
ncbi:MAG: cofactor-independent phosphoglycerate mutase [Methanomicrobiales archaeon]|nr:cofactor-independent phosphoglycerate mutase [Methanomicrobiales archaeon]